MNRVLIINGHPSLKESNANSLILEELSRMLPENLTIRHLEKLYKDFSIDIEAEQKALLDADIIILQFPFYWYSVPGILKNWIDKVFTYGFAFGSTGDKLKGKNLILSFTIGGKQEDYQPLGFNHFRIEELLKPLEQTVYLTGMIYHKPVYSHRMIYIPNVYNDLEEVKERARGHAKRLYEAIKNI